MGIVVSVIPERDFVGKERYHLGVSRALSIASGSCYVRRILMAS